MKKLLFWLEKYLGAALLLLVGCTWRYRVQNLPKHTAVYSLWHHDLLALLYSRRYEGAVVLVSQSDDGQLIAGPLQALGYATARGSSTRGGVRALLHMLRAGKGHSLALTPDGPKGPLHKVKPGAVFLARASGMPLVPVGVKVNGCWRVKSWDRLIIPKPFATIKVFYGQPLDPKAFENDEQAAASLEQAMLVAASNT